MNVVVTETQIRYFNEKSLEERIARDYINKAIREFVNEVRYIDTRSEKYNGRVKKNHWTDEYNQEPIKNNEKIRVYHGCSLETACHIAIEGTSGKTYHPRTYSYESGMNPLGIFVTTDFETAKKFGNDHRGDTIIEFTANSNDLESPIWNGQSTYFGQGTNPVPFNSKEERKVQKQEYRKNAQELKDDEYVVNGKLKPISMQHIRNSDKPELANSIFRNNEHQALFMGDLNPNMIKRIWVNLPQENGHVDTTKSYQPMSVKEFLRKFKDKKWYDSRDHKGNEVYSKITSNKLFKPNDNVSSFNDLIDAFMRRKSKRVKTREKVESNLRDMGFFDNEPSNYTIDAIGRLLWPKQIVQLYGKDFFDKYFNRLGQ